MRKLRIPQPVNDDTAWTLVTLCVPDTADWHYLLRSCLTALVRGRSYDETTGNIRQAVQVAHEVLDSMNKCDISVIDATLKSINASIRQLQLAVNVNAVCCESMNEPPPPPPPPPAGGGWQDVPGPGNVPDDGYGEYQTAEEYRTAACDMVNGVIHAVFRQLDWLHAHQGWVLAVGVIAGLLLLLFPEAMTSILGGATLATIATAIFTSLDVGETFAEVRADIEDWLGENWHLFADDLCNLMSLQDLLLTIYSLLYERLVEALVARGMAEATARQLFCWLDGRMVFHQMTEFLARRHILQPDENYTYYPCNCQPMAVQYAVYAPTLQTLYRASQCQAEFDGVWWNVTPTGQWPDFLVTHGCEVGGRRQVGVVLHLSSAFAVSRELGVGAGSACGVARNIAEAEYTMVVLLRYAPQSLVDFASQRYPDAYIVSHWSDGCDLPGLETLLSGFRYGPIGCRIRLEHIMERLD